MYVYTKSMYVYTKSMYKTFSKAERIQKLKRNNYFGEASWASFFITEHKTCLEI